MNQDMETKPNQQILEANYVKINRIKEEHQGKKMTKLNRLRVHLLAGYVLTGRIMTARYAVYSYRDAIYDLRKSGMNIEGKTVTINGVQHQEWWLSDYEYEWVKERTEEIA